MLQEKYKHLANPRVMRQQMESAVEAKRAMFEDVVKTQNKRLIATIAEYFAGVQVAVDRIGDVLAVQFGVNLRSMHPEERRRYMAPAVNRELDRVVRQRRDDNGPLPEAIHADANMREALDFTEQLAGNEMGRRMLDKHMGRSYSPRWGDEEMQMDGPGRR
jgi:predicted RNA polymerase sigma factor